MPREVSLLLEFLAKLPSPEETLALRPSPKLQARMTELLEKNRTSGLTPEEREEVGQYEVAEHLVRMAKGRALVKLEAPGPAVGRLAEGNSSVTMHLDIMDVHGEQLAEEVLSLPAADRAELAHRLISSLDEAEDVEADAAGHAEALRRLGEINRGEVEPISADELFRRVRQRLAR